MGKRVWRQVSQVRFVTAALFILILFALPAFGQQVLMQTDYAQDGLIHLRNNADWMAVDYAVVYPDGTRCEGILDAIQETTCPANGAWAWLYSTGNIVSGVVRFSGGYLYAEFARPFAYTEANDGLGFAIANVGARPQTAYVWLLDLAFRDIRLVSFSLAPGEYVAMFAYELFPEFRWDSEKRYYLDVYSDLSDPQPLGILMADCPKPHSTCTQVSPYPQN